MDSADIWYELGNTYHETGILDKAVEAYKKAIDQNLHSGWLYNNLASIYVQQGNYLEAIPLYQKSLELFSNPVEQSTTWGKIGNIYHRLNEFGKAIQAFQKADEIMPTWISAKADDGSQKEEAEGKNILDYPDGRNGNPIDHKQIDPGLKNSSEYETEESQLWIDTESSRADIDELIEDKPGIDDSAEAWNELGLILFKVGAYDDAIDAYQKAIARQPKNGYFYGNLGQVYLIQGKLMDAIDLYEKSIALFTNNKDKAISWTRLGDIYRQLDKYDLAVPAYQLADVLNQTQAMYTDVFRQVGLELIVVTPGPVRGMDEINDLVLSIRLHGIIQPLIVCPGRNNPGKYMLIAGRRRLEAAKIAGLKEVPVIVRQASNQEILELSINENIHSMAANPFELAKEYQKMINEFDLSIEEISARVGRSCHSVANTMKNLETSDLNHQSLKSEFSNIGQKIIDQSLAKIQSGNIELQNQSSDIYLSSEKKNIEKQTYSSRLEQNSELESSQLLWYLDTKEDEVIAQSENDFLPANSSLKMRALHVLKSNPQTRRQWAT